MTDPFTMVDLTICIPTYERHDFLLNAVKSCIQTVNLNIEIIIGDDSIKSMQQSFNNILLPSNYTIKYFHHKVSLGQSRNVDFLFKKSDSIFLILLHDDDQLLPDSIQSYWDKYLITQDTHAVYFGKQKLMNDTGELLPFKSIEDFNSFYGRSSINEGYQQDKIYLAMKAICPGSSFMIPVKFAKQIGYSFEYGDACDYDFIIKYALFETSNFFFLDNYISIYRLSENSITKNKLNNSIYYKHILLQKYNLTSKYFYKEIFKADFIYLLKFHLRANKHLEIPILLYRYYKYVLIW
jgi:glycosyltransferase involved in cell wall biosynthesis